MVGLFYCVVEFVGLLYSYQRFYVFYKVQELFVFFVVVEGDDWNPVLKLVEVRVGRIVD